MTNRKPYDIIRAQQRKENLKKTRKVNIMKKNTLRTIYTSLLDFGYESTDPIMEEIATELNRGAEEKAAKNAEYMAVKDIILGALMDTPATIAEIYESIKDELPDGFTRNKVQYAITRLFADEVAKFDGKPNTYALKGVV